MDFALTEARRERRDALLAAVAKELPGRPGDGPEDHFDRDEWHAAASLGLTGLCLPVDHGGGGLGALDTALALEAAGRACADTGLVFGIAAHLLACAVPVRDFGAGAVRAELLTGFCSGDLVAANAMTEADAGSDTGGVAVTAVRDGDAYVLDGVKTFASNAPLADVLVTYAVTDPDAGFLGLSAFAVPAGLDGVRVHGPLRKMGLHGCPAGRVEFTGCRVPADRLLGAEGQGSMIFQHSMGWERAVLGALYLGVMDDQLDRCVEHAVQRRQFGRPVGANQAVSHRIADMRLRLEAARVLLYRACAELDRGGDHQIAAALSKVAVSEAAVANGLAAVQLFGGSGYLTETGVERQLRDAVPSTIFSGTTEIQKEIIAKGMGL